MKASISTFVSGGRSVPHKSMDFNGFMTKVRNNMTSHGQVLFTTKGVDLWEVYLNSFINPIDRQEHNCRCCKKFIEEFGGLAYLSGNGTLHSFLWDDDFNYGEFGPTVRALEAAVVSSEIDSVFITNEKTLGAKHLGGWEHFSIKSPESARSNDRLKTPFQLMAAKKEDFRMLNRALQKYSTTIADQALSLLQSDQLKRSELAVGIAKWFSELHQTLKNKRKVTRENLIWAAVAAAPVGFCNVSSSLIGSLMDDLVSGYSFEVVAQRFANKTNSTQYRRPSTAPGAQNIKRGEEIIEKLGYTRSLERRHARLEDLELLWQPRATPKAPAASQGVFRDVLARNSAPASTRLVESTAPATRMTFARFAKNVLPTAESMQVLVPARAGFSALLTAVHADAPNIMQWSNPVSWYVYPGGSQASQWGLKGNVYTDVTGITLQPNMWDEECPNKGEGVHFILEGCKDSRNAGLGLFPEILTSELNEVRKTIEAFSSAGKLKGKAQSNSSGIKFTGSDEIKIQVVSNNIKTTYILDRMD